MVAATVDGLRIVSLYAPNGRVVGSPFYAGKLAWFERLARWIRPNWRRAPGTDGALVLGGDLNVAPTDADVWDAQAVHGGTHVSEPERAAFRALLDRGLVDAYRARHDEAGPLHVVGLPGRQLPQEPRACASTTCWSHRRVAARVVDAEIDREARKGPPIPSDHAPLAIDLDARRPADRPGLGRAHSARIASRSRR